MVKEWTKPVVKWVVLDDADVIATSDPQQRSINEITLDDGDIVTTGVKWDINNN